MNNPTVLIKQHALTIFCALTIALTFAAILLPLPAEVIPVVIVFVPALMAIFIIALSDGKAGVRSLLAKLAQGHIRLKWMVIALALALVIRLTMSIIALGLGMISTIHNRAGGPAQFVILALILFIFALPEELGWPGYALPKLLEQDSPFTAGLIVGVLWGSLHLAVLLPGMMNESAPAFPTVLALVGGSVLFTWLYINSGGSVLLTTLFHAAQSFFVIVNDGITAAQQTWLMAGVYLAAALIIVIIAGSGLTRKLAAGLSQVVEATRPSQSLAQK